MRSWLGALCLCLAFFSACDKKFYGPDELKEGTPAARYWKDQGHDADMD